MKTSIVIFIPFFSILLLTSSLHAMDKQKLNTLRGSSEYVLDKLGHNNDGDPIDYYSDEDYHSDSEDDDSKNTNPLSRSWPTYQLRPWDNNYPRAQFTRNAQSLPNVPQLQQMAAIAEILKKKK